MGQVCECWVFNASVHSRTDMWYGSYANRNVTVSDNKTAVTFFPNTAAGKSSGTDKSPWLQLCDFRQAERMWLNLRCEQPYRHSHKSVSFWHGFTISTFEFTYYGFESLPNYLQIFNSWIRASKATMTSNYDRWLRLWGMFVLHHPLSSNNL